MRTSGNELVLSATDLSNFLSCRHLTGLEMAEARGKFADMPPEQLESMIDEAVTATRQANNPKVG